MRIVIDGYNMLRQFIWTPEISQQERNHFITQLAQYSKKKGHDITVIFDGGPYQWPSEGLQKGITVIYAGVRSTADDCIRDYLSERLDKEVLLVTSDRELNEWSSDHGVFSLSSGNFWKILKENQEDHSEKKQTRTIKTSKEENGELDTLMQEGNPAASEFEEAIEVRRSPSKKSSKEERRKQALLKKL